MTNCPTRETLERLAYGFLDKKDAASARAHLDACPDCRTLMNDLTADGKALADAAKAVTVPKVPQPSRRWGWFEISVAASAAAIVIAAVCIFAWGPLTAPRQEFLAGPGDLPAQLKARVSTWDDGDERGTVKAEPAKNC